MRLNGKTFNPGELRTPITLKSRTITKASGGFQNETFTKISDAWSKWVNVHGSEAWIDQSLLTRQAATVIIRYRSDIDSTCVVEKNGVVFEIISPPDNIHELNEYLELRVQLLVKS